MNGFRVGGMNRSHAGDIQLILLLGRLLERLASLLVVHGDPCEESIGPQQKKVESFNPLEYNFFLSKIPLSPPLIPICFCSVAFCSAANRFAKVCI